MEELGNGKVAGVWGKWGAYGGKENGEHLMDMHVEKEGWDEWKNERRINYIVVERNLRKESLDAYLKGCFTCQITYYAVLAKIIAEMWMS